MPRRQAKAKLGDVLVRRGHITPDQLQDAIRIQQDTAQSLGFLLTSIGLITPTELKAALAEQAGRRMPLGQILVKAGLLTPQQLSRILTKQINSRPMLGQILVAQGLVTLELLDEITVEQLEIERGEAAVRVFGSLIVEQVPSGSLSSNVYVVTDKVSGQTVLVDAGHHEDLLERVRSGKVRPSAVWLTHGHGDHVGALEGLQQCCDCPIYAHPLDEAFLPPLRNLRHLRDGDRLRVGAFEFEVFHTPGHTPGGTSYYCDPVAFTGDTLMAGAVGRYDLVEGSLPDIVSSLRQRLLALPDETTIFGGHGRPSRLFEIKRDNPFCAFLLRPAVED